MSLASGAVGTPAVNFAIFAFFVLVTLVIAVSYRRWARRRLDPLSDRLRNRLEEGRR